MITLSHIKLFLVGMYFTILLSTLALAILALYWFFKLFKAEEKGKHTTNEPQAVKQPCLVWNEALESKITQALEAREYISESVKEPVTLVRGFVSQPYEMELSRTLTVGGPSIPMIMLVGTKTGQVYFFALYSLIEKEADGN